MITFCLRGKGRAEQRGKYGKTEGHEVEFKSSYVFRNENCRQDIDYQGRGQVFEAVCGFLNTGGGSAKYEVTICDRI